MYILFLQTHLRRLQLVVHCGLFLIRIAQCHAHVRQLLFMSRRSGLKGVRCGVQGGVKRQDIVLRRR